MILLHRRPAVIANEIRLKRSQHEGSFLVVEGRDDRLFCERHTDAGRCSLVVAEGKLSVLEVIGILDADGFAGVLGIVDSDYDFLAQTVPTGPNVVTGDSHDLEVALLRSPALDRILVELGSKEKIQSLGVEVRELLFSPAASVGYLRWLSQKENLGLKFHGLNLASCVDRNSLEIDPIKLCRQVKNLSKRPEVDELELHNKMEALRDRHHDKYHVCCGDDVLQILSVGLRKVLGTNSAQIIDVEQLKQKLRLAFEDADFKASVLGAAIRGWESRNTPFRVLNA